MYNLKNLNYKDKSSYIPTPSGEYYSDDKKIHPIFPREHQNSVHMNNVYTNPISTNKTACNAGYTGLSIPNVGTKCYKCSDPTSIPYYIAPVNNVLNIPINNNSFAENQNTDIHGKVACDIKPFVTYNLKNTKLKLEKSFQCDGGAELTWIDLPIRNSTNIGNMSPLDPGYVNISNDRHPRWLKNDTISQEPRCTVIIDKL